MLNDVSDELHPLQWHRGAELKLVPFNKPPKAEGKKKAENTTLLDPPIEGRPIYNLMRIP